MTLAQLIDGDLELLLFDVVVLLVLGSARKTLPWETASQEVQQHVSDCLKIISSGLFVPDVSVNASVSGSTSEVFALAEGDVLTIRVLVAFSETEIDDENVIFVLIIATDQKVIRLNISMNDPLLMDLLNSLNLFK